jgi:hypothetical protein
LGPATQPDPRVWLVPSWSTLGLTNTIGSCLLGLAAKPGPIAFGRGCKPPAANPPPRNWLALVSWLKAKRQVSTSRVVQLHQNPK